MLQKCPGPALHRAYILFSIVCLSTLASSFAAQYIWGLQPCNLCVAQRVPYAIALVFSLGGIFFKKHHIIFQLLSICFLVGLALSIYHLAVQFGLIKDRCRAATIANDIQVFEDLLQKKKGCGEISWKLFGLPLPLINSVLFSALALLAHFFKRSRIVQAIRYFGR